MELFTLIVLIMFVSILVCGFMYFLIRDCPCLMALTAIIILMFMWIVTHL